MLTRPALPAYSELHCLTNFTFLRGASHAEALVVRAQELGYSALAITDECSLAGVVRAHVAAKQHGLKLIIGTEVQIEDGPKLVLLATNRESYGHIAALITRARRRAVKGSYRVTLGDLEQNLDHCLVLLVPPSAHLRLDDLDVATPIEIEGKGTWQATLQHALYLHRRFPQRAWIAVELLSGPNDKAQLAMLHELAALSGLPLVAAGDVHMHLRSCKPLQDTLTAIRLGVTVAAAGHHLQPNAERHLRPRAALARIYPLELLAETQRIADLCDFSLDVLRYEYPHELTPPGKTPAVYLRELTYEGLARRYPQGTPPHVVKQIEHELQLLSELQYEHFVLTVYDVVTFARSQHILCQGRGSAANSAVCYALGITEVDPARMSMLFERFVSRERDEPPDIDVDFEHQRREEVIQYIYNKYGRDRAALAATVISYRAKSALRDVGKALGLEAAQIERLARSMSWWDGRKAIPERLRECGIDPQSELCNHLILLINLIIGFPRHLSQHVGGFIISQGPLGRLVPIENAAMPERSVIQWDKDDLEALGLLKVDVLALGMLSAIRRTLDFVSHMNAGRGAPLTMQQILDRGDDQAVYQMIQRADTIGVFQIESRAQMTMLPRLRPERFYDLVIEVAIVRPGPIQGGMVHPYLRRRQGLEPVSYPSEAVKAVLERTLGVPIFQEQVMQLAIVAAGFTPGEADQLRRSMAAWKKKGGLEHFHPRLLKGMLERGYTREFAEQIYQQICGFGEYGFPESHSASFALLAYVSSWLKHYEPAAFLAGMLNSQPLGFLFRLATGAGRAAPRCRSACGRCDGERVGMYTGNARGRHAGGAAGVVHDSRVASGERASPHQNPTHPIVCRYRRSLPTRSTQPRRPATPRPGRRARKPRRPPPQCTLAGRRRAIDHAVVTGCAHLRDPAATVRPQRRAGHRRRLSKHRPDTGPPSVSTPAPASHPHEADYRRGTGATAQWLDHPRRRHCHLPPAPRHRQRRGVRHAGG